MPDLDPSRDYSRPNPELPLKEQADHLEQAILRLGRAKQEMEVALRSLDAVDLRQHVVLRTMNDIGSQIGSLMAVRRSLVHKPSSDGFGFVGEALSGN